MTQVRVRHTYTTTTRPALLIQQWNGRLATGSSSEQVLERTARIRCWHTVGHVGTQHAALQAADAHRFAPGARSAHAASAPATDRHSPAELYHQRSFALALTYLPRTHYTSASAPELHAAAGVGGVARAAQQQAEAQRREAAMGVAQASERPNEGARTCQHRLKNTVSTGVPTACPTLDQRRWTLAATAIAILNNFVERSIYVSWCCIIYRYWCRSCDL
jgi:hypothetical protein